MWMRKMNSSLEIPALETKRREPRYGKRVMPGQLFLVPQGKD